MLKPLSNRLQRIFVAMLMGIITFILVFSFLRQFDAQEMADMTYIQRIASLLIYELKDHPENVESILRDYETQMSVYSQLQNQAGRILYKSDVSLPTSLDTLLNRAGENINTLPSIGKVSSGNAHTIQSGYVEISGEHHDRYLMIASQIPVNSNQIYNLTVLTRKASLWNLFWNHLPVYGLIWFLSFLCVLFLCRWMLKKAFLPTEQMLQSHRSFIASASHELKSPLAVIMANTELLQKYEMKEPQASEILSVIEAECSRMANLIKDLLFLASSDANQQQLLITEVEVDTILFSLYEAFEPLCLKKKIQLIPDISSESYPVIYTDSERLFQLLSIYMDNAISYSPERSTIELRAVSNEKELIFFVADHGKGIAPKDQSFIFDRFYCADASRTEKHHFGLGLSIAKELADLLGGKIGFQETDGGGATFFLKLPLS